MLNFSKEIYNKGIQRYIIEKAYCNKCESKFIKVTSEIIGVTSAKLLSNIDFNSCECNVCNNHAYDVKDLNKDKEELQKIIENTYTDNTSTQLRAETLNNMNIGNLWYGLYSIGKYGYNSYNNWQLIVSKYAIKCSKCGYIKLTDNDNLNEIAKLVCNCCKQKLIEQNNNKYDSIINKIKDSIQDCIKYMEKQKDINSRKETKEIINIENKEASGFSKMKHRFKKHNPNMELLAAYKIQDLEKSLICCTLCGTPSEVSTHRMRELKNFECSGCKAQIENPNYLGLYKRDITNTTKNGLVCIGQDEDKVELKCKYCGTFYKNKNKTRFLMGRIMCNNKDTCSSVLVNCPKCKCPVELKNKEILNSESNEILCAECNENIYLEANNEIIATDARIEINEGLRYLSTRIKKPVRYENSLGRSAEPIYRGTDGIDYYNCRCVAHNQSCVLNEDEINTNPHKYCNNINNIFIDEEEFKNLKLNKESSLAERKEKN